MYSGYDDQSTNCKLTDQKNEDHFFEQTPLFIRVLEDSKPTQNRNNYRELPNKNLNHPFANYELSQEDLRCNLAAINYF